MTFAISACDNTEQTSVELEKPSASPVETAEAEVEENVIAEITNVESNKKEMPAPAKDTDAADTSADDMSNWDALTTPNKYGNYIVSIDGRTVVWYNAAWGEEQTVTFGEEVPISMVKTYAKRHLLNAAGTDADAESAQTESTESDAQTSENYPSLTKEAALTKVNRTIECYKNLVATNDPATLSLIDTIECFGRITDTSFHIRTSDGYELYSNEIITDLGRASICNIFFEYANGIREDTVSLSEYVASNTAYDILYKYNSENPGNKSSDERLMLSAIHLSNYLSQADTIKAGKIVHANEPYLTTNKLYDAMYEVPLIVDGEKLTAAYFTEDGTLIQITMLEVDNEDEAESIQDKICILTFPNGYYAP